MSVNLKSNGIAYLIFGSKNGPDIDEIDLSSNLVSSGVGFAV